MHSIGKNIIRSISHFPAASGSRRGKIIFLLVFLFLSGSIVFAQEEMCSVMMPSLSGYYTGGCRNGLAHGRGIADGTDHYEGRFKKGLPDGKGIYTWANGSFYDGQWKDGVMEGKGRMVINDSIVTGYWRNNRYIGRKLIPSYEIDRSNGVTRSTIRRSSGSTDGVRIRILQAGTDNTAVNDFSMTYSSGNEYRKGYIYGVENTLFPLVVKIRYNSWNLLRTNKFMVLFEFTINEPGTWDVTITN